MRNNAAIQLSSLPFKLFHRALHRVAFGDYVAARGGHGLSAGPQRTRLPRGGYFESSLYHDGSHFVHGGSVAVVLMQWWIIY